VIERVLNHVSSFAGIDFAEEKTAALDLWAKHILDIVAATLASTASAV
jgi:hypothetical protein